MQLYKLANQPIYSRLKVNNWSHHLLYVDVISFFVKRNVKKFEKLSSYFLNDLRNFNEISIKLKVTETRVSPSF